MKTIETGVISAVIYIHAQLLSMKSGSSIKCFVEYTAEPLELECTSNASESGLIEVKCTPSRALQNVTCSIDGKAPEVCE